MTILLAMLMLLLPIEETNVFECTGVDHPAIVTVYDPALGGINCDGDCGTIATGLFEPWMYRRVAACDISLLGRSVRFPGLGLEVQCLDTGGAIRAMYSLRDSQCVLFFDILYPLHEEEPPYWNWWFIEDWEIVR